MLNTVVNYLGIEITARVNKIMLVGELIVLAIFLVIGVVALAAGQGPRASTSPPIYNSDTFSLALVLRRGLDRGAVASSASTASRCWPRRTASRPGRSAARWSPRCCSPASLFIVQTWVAALLVPDPAGLIAKGDAGGTAFYDAAEVAGGHWLSVLTAVATAIAWGFANSLVAQAATSRLLFAMARDRQLPSLPGQGAPDAAACRSTPPCWSRSSRWRWAST